MTSALSRMIERVQTGRSDVLPRRAARFEPDGAGAEPGELGPAELGPVALGAAEPGAATLEPAELEALEPASPGRPTRTPAAEILGAAQPRQATAVAWPASPAPLPPSPSPIDPQANTDPPSQPPAAPHGADHPGILHEIEVLVRQAATAQPTPPARANADTGPVEPTGYDLGDEAEPQQQAGVPQPWLLTQPVRAEPRARTSVQEPVSPPPEPGLSIEIGRIEIIAPPRAPERRIAPRMGPRLDLEGYLSARRKGER